MTHTATREIEIGLTPRPRFVDATYAEADKVLVDELRPLGEHANAYGWYGPHGYKDLPDLTEDLHNRRNVLAAAARMMEDEPNRKLGWVAGTRNFSHLCDSCIEAQQAKRVKVVYCVRRAKDGNLYFTEVA